MFLGEIFQGVLYSRPVIRFVDLPVHSPAEKFPPLMIQMLRLATPPVTASATVGLPTTVSVFEESWSFFFGHGYSPNRVKVLLPQQWPNALLCGEYTEDFAVSQGNLKRRKTTILQRLDPRV